MTYDTISDVVTMQPGTAGPVRCERASGAFY